MPINGEKQVLDKLMELYPETFENIYPDLDDKDFYTLSKFLNDDSTFKRIIDRKCERKQKSCSYQPSLIELMESLRLTEDNQRTKQTFSPNPPPQSESMLSSQLADEDNQRTKNELQKRIESLLRSNYDSIKRVNFSLDLLGHWDNENDIKHRQNLLESDDATFKASIEDLIKRSKTGDLKDPYSTFEKALEENSQLVNYESKELMKKITASSVSGAVTGSGVAVNLATRVVQQESASWISAISAIAVKYTPGLSYIPEIQTILPRYILKYLPSSMKSSPVSTIAGDLSYVSAPATLSAQLLYYAVEYKRNKMTKERFQKKVADCLGSTTSGLGMAAGMGALGGLLACGPIGLAVLSLSGGVFGCLGGQMALDSHTTKYFGLTCDETVEKAYLSMNLTPSASNDEVNTAFEKLFLEYYPQDGDGTSRQTEDSKKKFENLLQSMQIINSSRMKPQNKIQPTKFS